MTAARRPHRWLPRPAGSAARLEFGADYNPDQWPREVWDEDVALMREAGVTIVSLGIFSWARLQPEPDRWDFEWLDEVMDVLHAGGITVDLATATASPPPWLTTNHPEILPVGPAGETIWPGSRQHWRPTSPIFRDHALRLVTALAERYADHPALVAWHVNNELGCHNAYDYSDDAATAFRHWLQSRYGSIDTLNHAWGTAFWSQRYGDFTEILPPRLAATIPNPTQVLDFKRFSSDALKGHLRAERDILQRLTPGIPVTTNFMVMGTTNALDYADWASEVDFVSNDHYVIPGPHDRDELSFSANLTGNLAGGAPWFLMEHSTSAVNWQPINLAKKPGELARDSLTHVAHGADAVCFFQWRQSSAGAEKYHSAMVPHAGRDSRVFRDVVTLGDTLRALAPIAGTHRRPADIAILFDWQSWWALDGPAHPTTELRYREQALAWYTALLDLGLRADVLPVAADLTPYRVVIAPLLHVVPTGLASRLADRVAEGCHLVTTFLSGIVDENDHIHLGGYPGALRDLLGIRVEEFAPRLPGESIPLDDGTTGTLWSEPIDLTDPTTEVLVRYAGGTLTGRPAITRRTHGLGSATYVSTRLTPEHLQPLLRDLTARAGVTSPLPPALRSAIEATVRTDGEHDWTFLINRTASAVDISEMPGDPVHPRPPLPVVGRLLAPHGVAVLSTDARRSER